MDLKSLGYFVLKLGLNQYLSNVRATGVEREPVILQAVLLKQDTSTMSSVVQPLNIGRTAK